MHRRILAITTLYILSLVACDQREERQGPSNPPPPATPRDRAISAAIARGDSVLAAGDTNEARIVYRVILAFDSTNVEARKRFTPLPDRGLVITEDEAQHANKVTPTLNPAYWCNFPVQSDSGQLLNLEMLSDVRLLPRLRSAGLRAQLGKCRGIDAFLMLGQPTSTIGQVRERYGAPQAEAKNPNGSVVLTYGRFRIFGSKDGQVIAVVIPPFAF
jgi:hypothetical protein